MKLYGKFFVMQLKILMQYKVSFVFLILGRLVLVFGEVISIFFLFDRYNSLKGFTIEDVLICATSIILSFGIAECFARGFDIFPRIVRNGEFDRIMVRPRNEVFLILAGKIDFVQFSRAVPGIVMLIYVLCMGYGNWTADNIFVYIMMIIAGVVVFSSLMMLYAGLCFFTLEGLEFMNIFIYGGRNFGQYPLMIFGKPILKFLTFVIPLALFQYYPLLYVLGKSTNKFYMFTPFIAMLFIIPAYGFWRFGVKKYKSNGS